MGDADGGEGLLECAFLVPLVRDSDRKPHRPLCWNLLEDASYEKFGGRQGPEELGSRRVWPDRVYRSVRPVPGEYRSQTGSRVRDESRRYIVAVERRRVSELRRLLEQAANTFDQEAIYLSVRGEVEFVVPIDE